MNVPSGFFQKLFDRIEFYTFAAYLKSNEICFYEIENCSDSIGDSFNSAKL